MIVSNLCLCSSKRIEAISKSINDVICYYALLLFYLNWFAWIEKKFFSYASYVLIAYFRDTLMMRNMKAIEQMDWGSYGQMLYQWFLFRLLICTKIRRGKERIVLNMVLVRNFQFCFHACCHYEILSFQNRKERGSRIGRSKYVKNDKEEVKVRKDEVMERINILWTVKCEKWVLIRWSKTEDPLII